MSTDNAIHAEATYRTSRARALRPRPNLRRVLLRIVWRPSGIVALIAAVPGAATVDHAVDDVLTAVGIPADLRRA